MVKKNLFSVVGYSGALLVLFVVTFFFALFWVFRAYFLPRFRFALEQTFANFVESGDLSSILPGQRFSKEDSRGKNKVKDNGKVVDESIEMEVVSKALKQERGPKIVGFGFKILGPFTKRFVENFLANNRGISADDVSEKGYFQAHEISRKSGGRSAGFSDRL